MTVPPPHRDRYDTTALRAAFAARLSVLYGREVPAYTTLVDVAREVNADVLSARGPQAQRLGSIERVTAERHGAIRVGTPAELAAVARVFGALGMVPVGFYDLRETAAAVPVVSTAFRPVDRDELARNPFRVFTSLLVVDDRRFFTADLAARLREFLSRRTLFPPPLLALADRATREGGLDADDAEAFLSAATAAFALSPEPVDRSWYAELSRVSSVAADIGGVTSTHINHLTPRVLDIDELYARMQARGIEMIDEIQGPPRWGGPDLLLRQTSFRALAEPRRFREPDGRISDDTLRVRFGEVEARGLAATPRGRALYDRLLTEPGDAAANWRAAAPATERGMLDADLAYFTLAPGSERPDGPVPTTVAELLDGGWAVATPVVYEDFLPASAAGIFRSNLTGDSSRDDESDGAAVDLAWLEGAAGRQIHDPYVLYDAERAASLDAVTAHWGLPTIPALPGDR
ncbi:2-oxoadipate dioxygenase/decarboxylase family protein [Rhodococcoides corynebacterioides]|uniref:2-oxoadipate dioxygenase/decarboxylase n=1 Tax=Rhodococcoides corynebacterioides TaxID=53972 RepID=UPI003AE9483E